MRGLRRERGENGDALGESIPITLPTPIQMWTIGGTTPQRGIFGNPISMGAQKTVCRFRDAPRRVRFSRLKGRMEEVVEIKREENKRKMGVRAA